MIVLIIIYLSGGRTIDSFVNPHLGKFEEILAEYAPRIIYEGKKYLKIYNKEYWDEVVHEGRIGLFEAYKKYDPKLCNVKFWSYARWRVRGRIIDFIHKHSNFLKPNPGVANLANKIKKMDISNWGNSEIAEALGKSVIQVSEALEFLRTKHVDSLNRIVNEDSEQSMELGDLLPDPYDYFNTTDNKLWNSLNEYEQQYLNFKLQGYSDRKLRSKMCLTNDKQNEIETSLKHKAQKVFGYLEKSEEEAGYMSSSYDKSPLTKVVYLKHKKSKMIDKEICKKYNISRSALVKFKASWGISDSRSTKMKQKTIAIAAPPKNSVVHFSSVVDADNYLNQIEEMKERVSQLEGELKEVKEKLSMCENEREALWRIQDILRARLIV